MAGFLTSSDVGGSTGSAGSSGGGLNLGVISAILSMLQNSGGQDTTNTNSFLAKYLGRDTSDRSSAMNAIDLGGGLVDRDAAKARGLSTSKAIGANILDPTGFMGLGKGKGKKAPSLSDQYLELANTIRNFVQEDPMYSKPQEQLYGLGTALTTGENLPAWLKPLTTYGSSQLEDVIGRTKSDLVGASNEAAAIQGTRTGRNLPALNKAVADYSANLRYQDLLNTNSNIQSLFGAGLDTLANVRNTALSLGSLGTNTGEQLFESILGQQNIENKAKASGLASTGGAIGSILGMLNNSSSGNNKNNSSLNIGKTYNANSEYSFEPIRLRGSASGANIYA